MVDAVFIKKQRGYRRTAYNLAHRVHQILSARQARRHIFLNASGDPKAAPGAAFGPT
jgi:hypothetical protein